MFTKRFWEGHMDLEEDGEASIDEHLTGTLRETRETIERRLKEGLSTHYDIRDALAQKEELLHRKYGNLEILQEEVEAMQPVLNALIGYVTPPKPKFRRIA